MNSEAWKVFYKLGLASLHNDLEEMYKMHESCFIAKPKKVALEITNDWLTALKNVSCSGTKVIIDMSLFLFIAESILCFTSGQDLSIAVLAKFYIENYQPKVKEFVNLINCFTKVNHCVFTKELETAFTRRQETIRMFAKYRLTSL